MKKILIVFAALCALFLVWQAVRPQGAPTPPTQEQSQQTAQLTETLNAMVTTHPQWAEIVVDESGPQKYRVTVWYRKMPASQLQVRTDTRAVAQKVLDLLVKQGHQPMQERMSLSVYGMRAESGATGQNLTRVFGRSVYDVNSDSIEYKPKE